MSKQSDLVSVSQGSGGDPLYIDTTNDRVGVGTTSPTRQLEVSKAGTSYIRAADTTNSVNVDLLAASSGGWVGTQSNHPFLLQTNNTERMRIDNAGRVTMPYQPAFEGNGSGQSITSAAYTVLTFNSTLNRGSHFNGTSFTVPVSGVYEFHGRMEWNGSQPDTGSLYLAVNGSTAFQFLEYASGYYNGPNFSILLYLSANDYVQLWTFGNNYGFGTTYSNRFGGYLIG